MRFMNLLAKPFPPVENRRQKFIVALAFGLFVFLFLYFFKPFGIGIFTRGQLLLYTSGFGGITFIIMMINFVVLDKLFPSFFKEDHWTVGKEIFITLVYIALIGLGNYFFATWLSIAKPAMSRLLYLELISLSLAIFPVAIWTLVRENRLLKKNRAEADTFNPVLTSELMDTVKSGEPHKPGNTAQLPVIFTSEGETTVLRVLPENIFFVSAADNYIKLHLLEGDFVVAKLFRTSLKKAHDDLKTHPQFYRCHRAYIVNLEKVTSVTGNARGLKLGLQHCDEEIPVSRSLNGEIREKLAEIYSR